MKTRVRAGIRGRPGNTAESGVGWISHSGRTRASWPALSRTARCVLGEHDARAIPAIRSRGQVR